MSDNIFGYDNQSLQQIIEFGFWILGSGNIQKKKQVDFQKVQLISISKRDSFSTPRKIFWSTYGKQYIVVVRPRPSCSTKMSNPKRMQRLVQPRPKKVTKNGENSLISQIGKREIQQFKKNATISVVQTIKCNEKRRKQFDKVKTL